MCKPFPSKIFIEQVYFEYVTTTTCILCISGCDTAANSGKKVTFLMFSQLTSIMYTVICHFNIQLAGGQNYFWPVV